MKNKIISLPISMTKVNFTDSTQSDLTKVSLKVCKEGYVPSHDLYFDLESLENASESIKNKPLLCAYEVDNEGNNVDFQGHEYEYKVVRNNGKVTLKIEYLEQPIGVIPESCNFTVSEIDGEQWVTVDAYIFNEYCSDAIDIMNNNDGEKSVSMEIKVIEEYTDDDDITHIKQFAFTGVTLLGENHNPAISGANISFCTQTEEFSIKFTDMIDKINNLTSNKGGSSILTREEIIAKFSNIKSNPKFEDIVGNKNLNNEELEKQLFSLSVCDMELKIRESLDSFKCVHTDWWGDTYETNKYWLCDVLVAENIAIVEDNENWRIHYGIPYSINGDVISLDEVNKKRYIRGDWREFVDGEKEPELNPVFSVIEEHNKNKVDEINKEFETTKESLNEVKGKFTDLQSDKDDLDVEVKELKEFKETYEKEKKEVELEGLFSRFEDLVGVDGYAEIEAVKFELTSSELEQKLKVLAFDNGITLKKKKKSFSDNNSFAKIPVDDIKNEIEVEPYNGLLKKYVNK